jgi:signal transduction histidine kinase
MLRLTPRLFLSLLLTSVIPLLVLSFTSYSISSDLLLDEVQNANNEIVRIQRDQLDGVLEQIESLIFNLSGVEAIREALEASTGEVDDFERLSTQARIGTILNAYSSIGGLVSIDIFAASGARYHVGDTLNTENIDAAVLESIRAQVAASPRTVVWVGVEPNVNSESAFRQVVTAGRQLTRLNRETLQQEITALLMVNYSTDEIYEQLYAYQRGADAELIVIDADGRLVAHPDRARIGSEAPADLRAALTDDTGLLTTTIENQEVSISYARSAVSGWIVASITPLAVLNAKPAPIASNTLLTLIISTVVIIAVALLLNRAVARPITLITQRLAALQSGRVESRLKLPISRSDEVGELSLGFNQLVDAQIERRRIEQEREQLITQLEFAKRAAEESAQLKSEFLATMSHELRTPLNAIEGYTGIMLSGMGVELDPDTELMIERIDANSKRLLHLINDFLDLSRIESGRIQVMLKPVNVRSLAATWQDQISVLADQKSLDFAVSISDTLPEIIVIDSDALSKIVINLLSNAFKFTHQGGVTLTIDTNANDWCISVSDTGIGIPLYAQEFVFEEFRQVDQSSKREYGGTGLGLAIVKKLTRALGGSVTLVSDVGMGSTFTIRLPLRLPESVGVA